MCSEGEGSRSWDVGTKLQSLGGTVYGSRPFGGHPDAW